MWRELWTYRGLIRQLAVRDLKARYKVSVLGFFWSLLRPLLTIAVLAAVFSSLDFKSDRYAVPYAVLLLTSYMPWFFFSTAWLEGTQSILGNAQLVKKVYCPRAVFPTAVVLANLVNFAFSFVVLLPVLFWVAPVTPTWAFLELPLVILTHTAFLLGLCFITSIMHVLYRDTSQIVEFLVFVWFYLSPVLYDVHEVFQRTSLTYAQVYCLNPMVGLIEWYRYVLLASSLRPPGPVDGYSTHYVVTYAILFSLSVLILGYYLLKKLESRAVDEL